MSKAVKALAVLGVALLGFGFYTDDNLWAFLLGLLLVWAFLPKYALAAYIAMIYITETLNFVLSAKRLWKTVRELPAEPEEAAQR